MKRKPFVARPGKRVRLAEFRPDHTEGIGARADAARLLADDIAAIAAAQERLWAQDRYALLVIFQAMDGAGKDSTIKHVMSGVNPAGVQVTSFKAPSARELDHDYLWRSVVALPERGMIGIHNRSYYEEVLVARVHPQIIERQHLPAPLVTGDLWKRRYRHIRNFERFLVENGTIVLKFFLHVSREEQRRRFLERLEKPEKHWKFALQDVKERAHWDDYQRAYEQMLEETSTEEAPWYVIPADRKWYMQWAVGEIIVDTLRRLKIEMPLIDDARRKELAEGRRLLQAEGRQKPRSRAR